MYMCWINLLLLEMGLFQFLVGGTPAGEMAMVQVSMLPLWKKFLLNQFHDVIPGSCIRKVAEDAEKIYQGWWLLTINKICRHLIRLSL